MGADMTLSEQLSTLQIYDTTLVRMGRGVLPALRRIAEGSVRLYHATRAEDGEHYLVERLDPFKLADLVKAEVGLLKVPEPALRWVVGSVVETTDIRHLGYDYTTGVVTHRGMRFRPLALRTNGSFTRSMVSLEVVG